MKVSEWRAGKWADAMTPGHFSEEAKLYFCPMISSRFQIIWASYNNRTSIEDIKTVGETIYEETDKVSVRVRF